MKKLILLFIMSVLISGCSQEQPEVTGSIEMIEDQVPSDEPALQEVPTEKDDIGNEAIEDVLEEVDEALEATEEVVSESDEAEEKAQPLIFQVTTIDDAMVEYMMGKSFHENPHIQISDLRYVQTGYYGFDGMEHQGAIIVNEAIAEAILEIFTELYDAKYPIERMAPIDAYEGDDHASMIANNTSGFNYRLVSGTDKLSNHAYGLAVDINPLVNPWVTSSGKVDPEEGAAYADRNMDQQGMIKKGDACYEAFVSRGFRWGGDWKNSKDYQHFDIKITQ